MIVIVATKKQTDFIAFIESVTGNIFYGVTVEEATSFIASNIDTLNQIITEPTEKQIKYVGLLCKKHNVTFNGRTKKDYSNFISKFTSDEDDYIR